MEYNLKRQTPPKNNDAKKMLKQGNQSLNTRRKTCVTSGRLMRGPTMHPSTFNNLADWVLLWTIFEIFGYLQEDSEIYMFTIAVFM